MILKGNDYAEVAAKKKTILTSKLKDFKSQPYH